eukprot:CAMPEP_0118886814 /NCGR_PEP_ID=MMETSP1163-20130328/24766_1 /TAXON_ID=124430 /ORGANISM="Phaeomonas parva, Strain CCMP2877" /LENGTH=64 /DNA_ID=CAMNT_0006825119 /DNA_START=49 /DNA_END=240 /DNA_ORIENTATION=-
MKGPRGVLHGHQTLGLGDRQLGVGVGLGFGLGWAYTKRQTSKSGDAAVYPRPSAAKRGRLRAGS